MPCLRPQTPEFPAQEVISANNTGLNSPQFVFCFKTWRPVRFWLMAAVGTWLLGPAALAVPSPQDNLTQAWELSRLGEFSIALHLFEEVQKAAAATPAQKLDALFGEAHVWSFRTDGNDPEKARTLYAEVMKQAPSGDPLSVWSDYESVQSKHLETPIDSRDYVAIAKSYLELSQRQIGTPAGEEAYLTYLYLEQADLKDDPQDIVKKGADFIQAHPDSPWVSTIYSLIASCYDTLKQPRKEVDAIILSGAAAVKSSPPGIDVDNSDNYWQVAYIAEFEIGDFTLAREYYGKLIKEYPNDARVFPSKQGLARMDIVEAAARQGQTVPLNPRVWKRPWIQP
jgi:tetratricopeptide (TPR) repeat protein